MSPAWDSRHAAERRHGWHGSVVLSTGDLFGALLVEQPGGALPATRVDIGWQAWQSARPIEGRARQWAFLLACLRHFGQPHFLVRVDQEYRTATSLSIRSHADGLEVRVVQLEDGRAAVRHWLLRCLLRRHTGGTVLRGREVEISHHPEGSAVPRPQLGGQPADWPEALIDGSRQAGLPLRVRSGT